MRIELVYNYNNNNNLPQRMTFRMRRRARAFSLNGVRVDCRAAVPLIGAPSLLSILVTHIRVPWRHWRHLTLGSIPSYFSSER